MACQIILVVLSYNITVTTESLFALTNQTDHVNCLLLTLDTAALCETLKIHETSPRDCTMCMNQYKDPVYGLPCGHYFCKSCINCFIEKSSTCPQCSHEKLFRGNQPAGFMTWKTESRKSLPGYESCGTIVITYNFKEGIQGTVTLKSFLFKSRCVSIG